MTKHPDSSLLEQWLSGSLEDARSEELMQHIASCQECAELVAGISGVQLDSKLGQLTEQETEKIVDMIDKKVWGRASVKEYVKRAGKFVPDKVKKNKALLVMVGSFLASFAIPGYFIQALVVAGISAGVWIKNKDNRALFKEALDLYHAGDKEAMKEKLVELKKKIGMKE